MNRHNQNELELAQLEIDRLRRIVSLLQQELKQLSTELQKMRENERKNSAEPEF